MSSEHGSAHSGNLDHILRDPDVLKAIEEEKARRRLKKRRNTVLGFLGATAAVTLGYGVHTDSDSQDSFQDPRADIPIVQPKTTAEQHDPQNYQETGQRVLSTQTPHVPTPAIPTRIAQLTDHDPTAEPQPSATQRINPTTTRIPTEVPQATYTQTIAPSETPMRLSSQTPAPPRRELQRAPRASATAFPSPTSTYEPTYTPTPEQSHDEIEFASLSEHMAQLGISVLTPQEAGLQYIDEESPDVSPEIYNIIMRTLLHSLPEDVIESIARGPLTKITAVYIDPYIDSQSPNAVMSEVGFADDMLVAYINADFAWEDTQGNIVLRPSGLTDPEEIVYRTAAAAMQVHEHVQSENGYDLEAEWAQNYHPDWQHGQHPQIDAVETLCRSHIYSPASHMECAFGLAAAGHAQEIIEFDMFALQQEESGSMQFLFDTFPHWTVLQDYRQNFLPR